MPRANRDSIECVREGAGRVRVAARPVPQVANAAAVALLATAVGVPKRRMRLVAGETARRKRVLSEGVAPAELAERLATGIVDGAASGGR